MTADGDEVSRVLLEKVRPDDLALSPLTLCRNGVSGTAAIGLAVFDIAGCVVSCQLLRNRQCDDDDDQKWQKI